MRWLFCGTFLALVGCQCSPKVGAPCNSSAQCGAGLFCLSGTCQLGSHDAGVSVDAGTVDAGQRTDAGSSADAGCALTCGTTCCASGQTCESDVCRQKCGASETRCGQPPSESCCGASDVCYLAQCTHPGPACSASVRCPTGQYCEPVLQKCLPAATSGVCEFRPDGGAFTPAILWRYSATDRFTEVMMTPSVADVNGDGVPDVVANYFEAGGSYYNGDGVLRAHSGDDGHVLWTGGDGGVLIHPPANIAVGDLANNGQMLVITESLAGPLVAFDGKTGSQVWTSHTSTGAAAPCPLNWGGPAIANVAGDAKAEVICGFQVFDSTGLLLWAGPAAGGAVGSLVAVADLDNDGIADLTDGAKAFRGSDGMLLPWSGAGMAGFPAVADFVNGAGALQRDGKPEIAVINAGTIMLVNGQTGVPLTAAAALPGRSGMMCMQGPSPGNGGPPTVADFDGDGSPEVGVAGQGCYTVFKLDTAPLRWRVLWSNPVQDLSSSVTGSSVFDFEGDGQAEVVYADEVLLHVYRGTDGFEIFSRPHCSGTTYENPVIVDVDGNGRADIVLPDNTYAAAGLHCLSSITSGLQVFHDAKDLWVNTRSIWNQHTYHVTNVCDGHDLVCGGPGAAGNVYGRVPVAEPNSWQFTNAPPDAGARPLNNYRQNVQGDGLFSAPDLTLVDVVNDNSGCPTTALLKVRVVNRGALGVLSGIKVSFYQDTTPRTLIGTVSTTRRLLPGESEALSTTWPLPPGQGPFKWLAVVDPGGLVSECDEANNTVGPFEAACVMIN